MAHLKSRQSQTVQSADSLAQGVLVTDETAEKPQAQPLRNAHPTREESPAVTGWPSFPWDWIFITGLDPHIGHKTASMERVTWGSANLSSLCPSPPLAGRPRHFGITPLRWGTTSQVFVSGVLVYDSLLLLVWSQAGSWKKSSFLGALGWKNTTVPIQPIP